MHEGKKNLAYWKYDKLRYNLQCRYVNLSSELRYSDIQWNAVDMINRKYGKIWNKNSGGKYNGHQMAKTNPQSLYHPKNLKYLTSATQVSAAQNNNYLTNKISPQLTTAGLTYLLS